MNTKRLLLPLLAAAAGLAAGGCTAVSTSPVRVIHALGVDASCEPDSGLYVARLNLNVGVVQALQAQGQSVPDARWPFSWESTLMQHQITVDGRPVTGPEGNDFLAEAVEVTYQPRPPVGPITSQRVPMYAVLRAGATTGGNEVGIPLFTAAALEELAGMGLDAAGGDVNVTFTVVGRTAAGGALRTDPVTFPVRVYQSPACPTGTTPQVDATCSVFDASITCA